MSRPTLALLAATTGMAACSVQPVAQYPDYTTQVQPLPRVQPATPVTRQAFSFLAADATLGRCSGEQRSSNGQRLAIDISCSTGRDDLNPRSREGRAYAASFPAFGSIEQVVLPNQFNSANFTSCKGVLVMVDPKTHIPGSPKPGPLVHGPATLKEYGNYQVPAGMAAITSPVRYEGAVYNSSLNCWGAQLLRSSTLQLPSPQ